MPFNNFFIFFVSLFFILNVPLPDNEQRNVAFMIDYTVLLSLAVKVDLTNVFSRFSENMPFV